MRKSFSKKSNYLYARRQDESTREEHNSRRRTIEYRQKQNLRKKSKRANKQARILLSEAEKRIRKNRMQLLKNKKRRLIDPSFHLSENMRHSIYLALKSKKSGRRWENLVGWTLRELIEHFEKKRLSGMSLNNYGRNGWEWDHIIPQSLWKYEKPEDSEFKQCWALCNLQPLWAKDNRRKNNRLDIM